MISKKIAFVFLFTLILISCKTGYKVVKITSDKQPEGKNGFYYTLPNTLLKFNIIIEKTEKIKGPYNEYAAQYFGLNNVINQNSITYSIKDINIETEAEPDITNTYFVETNDARIKIGFNETGIIKNINFNDFARQGNVKKYNSSSHNIASGDYEIYNKDIANLNLYEKVDTFYSSIKKDTTFILEKTFKSYFVEKPTELKVKEIAEYISKIKEAKFNIITGDVDAVDKKNLEFMYNQLQNLEEGYLNLFTGITNHSCQKFTVSYLPLKDTVNSVKNEKLFYFSSGKGFSNDETSGSEAVFVRLTNITTRKDIVNFINKNNSLLTAKGKNNGFYYRYPATVLIEVLRNDEAIFSTRKQIAQMGNIVFLPSRDISVIFDEISGGIKLLKFNK